MSKVQPLRAPRLVGENHRLLEMLAVKGGAPGKVSGAICQ